MFSFFLVFRTRSLKWLQLLQNSPICVISRIGEIFLFSWDSRSKIPSDSNLIANICLFMIYIFYTYIPGTPCTKLYNGEKPGKQQVKFYQMVSSFSSNLCTCGNAQCKHILKKKKDLPRNLEAQICTPMTSHWPEPLLSKLIWIIIRWSHCRRMQEILWIQLIQNSLSNDQSLGL